MQPSDGLRGKIKLRDRCVVLVEISQSLNSLYSSPSATETQKHYIETILGAALWYLPTSKELWTGRISKQALSDFHPASLLSDPRLTEDHEYPRKVSAVELMRKSWSSDPAGEMLELYLNRYGRFNYVTPTENKVLVKYQKTHLFSTPTAAYEDAGIELISISLFELARVRKRDARLIETLLKEVDAES